MRIMLVHTKHFSHVTNTCYRFLWTRLAHGILCAFQNQTDVDKILPCQYCLSCAVSWTNGFRQSSDNIPHQANDMDLTLKLTLWFWSWCGMSAVARTTFLPIFVFLSILVILYLPMCSTWTSKRWQLTAFILLTR